MFAGCAALARAASVVFVTENGLAAYAVVAAVKALQVN